MNSLMLNRYMPNLLSINCSLNTYFLCVKYNKIIISISADSLNKVVSFLAKSIMIKANMLLDIWVTDYPERYNRFELSYLLVSLKYGIRYLVKTSVSEYNSIFSLTQLFPSANWLEREIWDMFGVCFYNHSDLRRILTDYGFIGHPLRKDFPLTGFSELRYDDSIKSVLSEIVEVPQEFRLYNYIAPWQIRD